MTIITLTTIATTITFSPFPPCLLPHSHHPLTNLTTNSPHHHLSYDYYIYDCDRDASVNIANRLQGELVEAKKHQNIVKKSISDVSTSTYTQHRHTHTHTHRNVHTHTYAHIRTHTHTHTHIHTHTHTYTLTHTHTHTHSKMYRDKLRDTAHIETENTRYCVYVCIHVYIIITHFIFFYHIVVRRFNSVCVSDCSYSVLYVLFMFLDFGLFYISCV